MVTAVAVRAIGEALRGMTQLVWLTTATSLATAVVTPTVGKLADQFGRKGFMMAGMAIVLAGTAGAGLCASMPQLAACRATQGLGWGMVWPMTYAFIQRTVPPRLRGRYIGFLTLAGLVGAAVAPVVGGALLGTAEIWGLASWRWLFWAQVPVMAANLAASALVLPREPSLPAQPVDWSGAAALALAVTPIVMLLARLREWHWDTPAPYCWIAAGLIGAALFRGSQRGMGDAGVMPPRMLRLHTFRLGLPVMALASFGQVGAGAVLPLFWLVARGLSPTAAGAMAFVATAGALAGSVFESRFMSATGRYKAQTVAGIALQAAGLITVMSGGADAPIWMLAAAVFAAGAGATASIGPIEVAMQRSVPPAEYGTAAGSVLLARTLGLTAGSALLLGALFAAAPGAIVRRLEASGARIPPGLAFDINDTTTLPLLPPEARAAVEHGFADAVAVALAPCLVALAIALVCALRLRERRFEPRSARPGAAQAQGVSPGLPSNSPKS
jgi:MFS family permease